MGMMPQIFFGNVMHGRLFPRRNAFSYRVYYVALPLSQLQALPIACNRPAFLSFYERDHGPRDGSDLGEWAQALLSRYGITEADGDIVLVCMPRIFGYVFNPVSFWLCHDQKGSLRAVLCEVNNTFGERHTYLCARDDHAPLTAECVLTGRKMFHVSPFLEREGFYTFRFDVQPDHFNVWIDFYDGNSTKQLVTSLVGRLHTLHSKNIRRAFWAYPFVTFKTILLIHWQALKLLLKRVKYVPKPQQRAEELSATDRLSDNSGDV